MKLKEFKKKLSKEVEKYPWIYKGEAWIENILNLDPSYDNMYVYEEWSPVCVQNGGNAVMRLSNFAIIGRPPMREMKYELTN